MQLLTMLLVVDHSDGFTLKFLSESQFHQVTSTAQIASLFRGRKPSGTTPLGANMRVREGVGDVVGEGGGREGERMGMGGGDCGGDGES